MNTKLLEDIGLTEGETKVYLALLKLGSTKTGPLSKAARISSSKVYDVLDRLEKKGLVGQSIENNVKYFKAMEPRTILRYMDEKEAEIKKKKQEIEKLIPELEIQQKTNKEKTRATLFEGLKSIKNFYNNLIEDLKAGEEYYVLGATYGKENYALKPFFQNYHTRRIQKKIRVIMLADNNEKGKLVPATLKFSNVRYLPKYLVTNTSTIISKDKVFVFFLGEEPKGFLIEDKIVANSYRTYFNTFWRMAER